MKKIEHFNLPEHTNTLYHKEAISSISLTRDVADKINELVNAYNSLSQLDLEWKQEQEGTIRKEIIYIKDNLINTLNELVVILENDGFFEANVKKYIADLERQVENLLRSELVDGELVDIRYGANSIIYETAGKAIREQLTKLKELANVLTLGENIFKKEMVIEGQRVYGFNGDVLFYDESDKSWFTTAPIVITDTMKSIILPYPPVKSDEYSYVAFTDKNDKYVRVFNYSQINEINDMIEIIDNRTIVHIDKIISYYPTIAKVVISATNVNKFDFYIVVADNLRERMRELETINKSFNMEIVVPEIIPCVVGSEVNLYFNNMLLNGNAERVQKMRANAYAGETVLYNDVLRIKPVNVFEYYPHISVFLHDTFNESFSKRIHVKAIEKNCPKKDISVLWIGDSRLNQGFATKALVENFKDDNLNLSLLGLRGEIGCKHEGRPAYGAKHYCTMKTYNEIDNPFYYNGFNFPYYMNNRSYVHTDYVVISLGVNDNEISVDEYISYINEMVTSISLFDDKTKIILAPSEGFSETNLYEWQPTMNHKTTLLNFAKAIIKHYDGGKVPNVYVAPTFCTVDLVNGFPTVDESISKRDTSITVKRVTDVIHPKESEHYKIADVIYSMIKYIETLN